MGPAPHHTTPQRGAPARMQGLIRSGGKVAKWAPLKLCVATVQTLRLFRSVGMIAKAEFIDSLSLTLPRLRTSASVP